MKIEEATQRLTEASALGKELRRIVVEHGLSQEVRRGAPHHIRVEAWQILGEMLDIHPIIVDTHDITTDGETKATWQAECQLVDAEGKVVGKGYSICSQKEKMWANRDEYAVMSMAQTRATGRAFRNRFGQIAKLAGYEVTPLEEMPQAQDETTLKTTTAAKVKRQTNATKLSQDQREKLGIIYKELSSKGEAATVLVLKDAGIECEESVDGFKQVTPLNFEKVVKAYEASVA